MAFTTHWATEEAMRWKVEVHSIDLADLDVAVGGLRARAFRDGNKTLLHADAFEQMDTATEVHQAAEALIASVKLGLLLSDSAAQPITVGAVVGADGSVASFVRPPGAELRARAGRPSVAIDGVVVSQPAESVLAKQIRL